MIVVWFVRILVNWVYYTVKYGFKSGLVSMVYFILSSILQYRRKIIEKNLRIIIPNVSAIELQDKVVEFYKHLSEMMVDTLWAYKASAVELKNLVFIRNSEVFEKIYQSGNNATIVLSHIGNWELFCQVAPLIIPKLNIIILYTPIKNTNLDKLMLSYRERFGAKLISTKSTLELYRTQKTKNVCINLFATDQNPGDPYHQYWTNFFEEKVPFITGAEKFAISKNQQVYFLKVMKDKNQYELTLIEIDYNSSIPFDMTNKTIHELEANIIENPSLWLLSHNRFKYKEKNTTI